LFRVRSDGSGPRLQAWDLRARAGPSSSGYGLAPVDGAAGKALS
jgi:hypothetical protein